MVFDSGASPASTIIKDDFIVISLKPLQGANTLVITSRLHAVGSGSTSWIFAPQLAVPLISPLKNSLHSRPTHQAIKPSTSMLGAWRLK